MRSQTSAMIIITPAAIPLLYIILKCVIVVAPLPTLSLRYANPTLVLSGENYLATSTKRSLFSVGVTFSPISPSRSFFVPVADFFHKRPQQFPPDISIPGSPRYLSWVLLGAPVASMWSGIFACSSGSKDSATGPESI